jgi:hypothetical protein
MVGAAWRLSRDPPQPPIREVLVHNDVGDVATARRPRRPTRQRGDDLEFDIVTSDG